MSKPISNSFFIPNALVDEYLQSMSGAEVKCYLFVVRKTLGWHKGTDAISISQFIEKTGLSNRSVIDACNSLVEKGLFKQTTGSRNVKVFSIDLDDSMTSEESSHVKKVHITSEESSLVTSEKSSHTKDTIKNTIQKTKESAPKKKSEKFDQLAALMAYGCSEQLAKDWLQVRKDKKSPSLTLTALARHERQAAKAGITPMQAVQVCVEKEWRAFAADWNWSDTSVNPNNHTTPSQTNSSSNNGYVAPPPVAPVPLTQSGRGQAADFLSQLKGTAK